VVVDSPSWRSTIAVNPATAPPLNSNLNPKAMSTKELETALEIYCQEQNYPTCVFLGRHEYRLLAERLDFFGCAEANVVMGPPLTWRGLRVIGVATRRFVGFGSTA
jgi:hypothetical protein